MASYDAAYYRRRTQKLRRRYRRRARWLRPGRRMSPREIAMVAAAAAGVALYAGHAATGAHAASKPPAVQDALQPSSAAAKAIAYARAQLGKPYVWGGTGPGGFDCSGLVMEAWRAAGVDIERTSEQQWATLPHIPASQVRPGDLVFFPGGDGSWAAPGHVAIVISATQMIQAYSRGFPIEVSPLNGDGAGGIVGYARP